MSRDDILNMPVGRELDALVAEKVMGLDVIGPNRDKVNSFPGWVWLASYSTDISAAWDVLEKKKSPECEVYWFFDHWQAWFGNNETAKGSTAPEAIVKAALLAVME